MTPAERALLRRLEAQARVLRPEMADRVLRGWELIRNSLSPAEFEAAVRSGQVERLLGELLADGPLDQAFSPLRQLIDHASLNAAESWSRFLPSQVQVGAFDTLSPRVIESIRLLDTRAVEGLKSEVRETVRTAVREGLEEGLNPRAVAKRAQESVGLSPQYERAVANFRRELRTGDRSALRRVLGRQTIRRPDGTTIQRSGHAGGHGLTPTEIKWLHENLGRVDLTSDQVEHFTGRYRRRLLAVNAEAHTRSMSLDTHRLAQRNAWQDAIDRGIVDATRLTRTWLAVGGPEGDGRNREAHLDLHGTEIGFYDTYPNGQLVPGEDEYGCRCGERIQLKAAASRSAA